MKIKVTGYLDIDPSEYDAGPNGPLTEEAWLSYGNSLGLDDVEFVLVEDD